MNPSENIKQARRLFRQIGFYSAATLPFLLFVGTNLRWTVGSFFEQKAKYWPSEVPERLQMPSIIACVFILLILWIQWYLAEKDFIEVIRKEFDIAFPILEERREELKRLKDEAMKTDNYNDEQAEKIALKYWMRDRIR